MEIQSTIESLLQDIEQNRKQFDDWIAKQMKSIYETKVNAQQIKSNHLQKARENKEEQENICSEIRQIQIREQNNIEEGKIILKEQQKIQEEMKQISKNFGLMEKKIILLKARKERLIAAKNKEIEEMKEIEEELNSLRTLYGISFHFADDSFSFNFINTNVTIVIKLDANETYQISSAPKEILEIKDEIMKNFNQNEDLYQLISSIRSCLLM